MNSLVVKSENGERWHPITQCVKVGSARSNDIVISGRSVLPIHSLIFQEEDQIVAEDLRDRKKVLLSKADLEIPGHLIGLETESDFWRRNQNQILRSFQDLLRADGLQALPHILTQLQLKWTFGKKMPEAWSEFLVQKAREVSLCSPIEELLLDEEISDIMINRFDEIWVERAGRIQRSSLAFTDLSSYQVYLENLLSLQGERIDESVPYLDFVLPDGSRGHLIQSPVSETAYLSIRRKKKKSFCLEEIQSKRSFDSKTLEKILGLMRERKNILISGSTGSGKTTLIQALINKVSDDERIIVLEDIPEISCDRSNTLYLRSRNLENEELKSIDLCLLVKQCLRMRPDRIVIGEVRGHEAFDLLMAMNTGHRGSLGAIHANSARDSLNRLLLLACLASGQPESVIRDLICCNIDALIFLKKDPTTHLRRVDEVKILKGRYENQWVLEDL